MSKVFEALLNNSLVDHCDKNSIIPQEQFGFKKKTSTYHAMNKLLHDLCKHLDRHEMVAAWLIDLEKAFDSVWLKRLLYRMNKLNFPRHILNIIHVITRDRKFITASTTGQILSMKFKIEEGLQQGSVNSSLLFNIYINQLSYHFDMNRGNRTYTISFADDQIVYVAETNAEKAKQKLQFLVNKVNNFYQQWQLNINPNKCETILFRLTTKYLSKNKAKGWKEFSIQIEDEKKNKKFTVAHQKTVKYLGMHLDQLLRLTDHVDIQLEKAHKAFKNYGRLFYNKNSNKKAKRICYCLLVRSILTYACPMWFNQSASTIEILRVFERKCLRACTSLYRSELSEFHKYVSNQFLYNTAEIKRIDNFVIQLTRL